MEQNEKQHHLLSFYVVATSSPSSSSPSLDSSSSSSAASASACSCAAEAALAMACSSICACSGERPYSDEPAAAGVGAGGAPLATAAVKEDRLSPVMVTGGSCARASTLASVAWLLAASITSSAHAAPPSARATHACRTGYSRATVA